MTNSQVKVGVPRALWYYTFYPFWRAFFTGLGAAAIPSQATTKNILDVGILETVSEACVPIKVFMGHIEDLRQAWQRGEIDMLFCPRYVSWQGGLIFCPKFLGLPDMVRYAFDPLPPLLTVRIDRRRPFAMWRACDEIRRQIGAPKRALPQAYRGAWQAHALHLQRLQDNWRPNESIVGQKKSRVISTENARRPLRLALLGYPYLVYDDYVSLGVLDKLEAMGVEVVTAETLQAQRKQMRRSKQKDMFWEYSEMVKSVGYYALSPACRDIDGVIHVTAFACGPDAMVNKLLELEARKEGAKAFLSLGLDEETGEAGCLTRLEAFVDMLRRSAHRLPQNPAGTT